MVNARSASSSVGSRWLPSASFTVPGPRSPASWPEASAAGGAAQSAKTAIHAMPFLRWSISFLLIFCVPPTFSWDSVANRTGRARVAIDGQRMQRPPTQQSMLVYLRRKKTRGNTQGHGSDHIAEPITPRLESIVEVALVLPGHRLQLRQQALRPATFGQAVGTIVSNRSSGLPASATSEPGRVMSPMQAWSVSAASPKNPTIPVRRGRTRPPGHRLRRRCSRPSQAVR